MFVFALLGCQPAEKKVYFYVNHGGETIATGRGELLFSVTLLSDPILRKDKDKSLLQGEAHLDGIHAAFPEELKMEVSLDGSPVVWPETPSSLTLSTRAPDGQKFFYYYDVPLAEVPRLAKKLRNDLSLSDQQEIEISWFMSRAPFPDLRPGKPVAIQVDFRWKGGEARKVLSLFPEERAYKDPADYPFVR